MQFTLIYSGELRANSRPDHKHDIRKEFHSQLKMLWKQPPLVDNVRWYDYSSLKEKVNLIRRVGAFKFVPLVSPDLDLICELKISMLRPEPPGSLITQGGDIDNRLKTLFDALRMPKNENELPKDVIVSDDEDPFFCLLEDDNLITSVSVRTDRLLISPEEASHVHLDIIVETRATRMASRNNVTNAWEISGGFALT
jgi:hypothetical protein